MSPALEDFLGRCARRLRGAVTLGVAQRWVVLGSVLVLAIVAIGWLRPWGWPEPAALGFGVALALAPAAIFVAKRVTPAMAARVADTNLASHDALSAALQFGQAPAPFGDRIRARADRVVAGASPTEAVPLRWRPRRWAIAALIIAAAVGLAVIANPQDDVRAQAAADRDAIDDEAARLDQLADEIDSRPDATADEQRLAAELRELADRLAELDELAPAEDLLRAEAPNLLSPRDFGQEAAVKGLDRSLQSQPLAAGVSGSAAAQLAAMAEQLDGLDAADQAALAERLAALADTQAAGNPDAQQALAAASQALAAGDRAGAGEALAAAAGAQRAGSSAVRSGESRRQASNAVGDAANRLGEGSGDGEGSGEGEGSGDGSGDGSGEGEGSGDGSGDGSGEGEGSGSGSGDGSGQGGAGGSPSGDVAGGSGDGAASGQGGQGRPTGGVDSDNPGAELDEPELFLPGGESDLISPDTVDDGGDTEITGLGPGATNAGSLRVPLADALAQVGTRAVEALDGAALPPSQRALVRDYFDALAGLAPDP